jgi:hypothetical protein
MLRNSSFLFQQTASSNSVKKPIKKIVKPNPLLAGRFYNNFWTYRVCQLTTSNVAAMKASGIASKDQPEPVASDIQVHGFHKFRGSDDLSLCVVVDKNSAHAKNLAESKKVSLMAGHTDPQIFHWFKLLGTVPPRSIISGTAEVLSGDLLEDVWENTFVRHPVLHDKAHEQWEKNETKTKAEEDEIVKRQMEEDERRMLRMSNSDWRSKPKERERNPTTKEDIEQPIYVMKSDQYVAFRLKPEVRVWGDYAGNLTRIWEETMPEMDPLARAAPRFIKMANMARGKLIASVNLNYNLKLTNLFVYSIDKKGLWAMATQETMPPPESLSAGAPPPRETWNEFRIEFGQDQAVETEAELEWWFKGMMRLGVPETPQYDQQVESQKESGDWRHT